MLSTTPPCGLIALGASSTLSKSMALAISSMSETMLSSICVSQCRFSVLSLADWSPEQLLLAVLLHRAESMTLRRSRNQRCDLASPGMTWLYKHITGLYRHIMSADDHKVQQQPGFCLRAALPPSISQRCNGAVATEICVGPDYLWC